MSNGKSLRASYRPIVSETLTFSLPAGEEALTNAVQAMKWQQLVLDVIDTLSHLGATGQPEHREAYRDAVRLIRDELRDAGLTVLRPNTLVQMRMERHKRYAKEMQVEMKRLPVER